MSRRNRNNNRYNSRNRSKWDDGYDDDYFDDDEMEESEDEESSDEQDEYDQSESDEEYESDEDYDEDESDEEEYDEDDSEDEEYDEDDPDEEEYDEDEYDEEYDEEDEEYDEDESDDEDVEDEEEDESDDDEDDELDSEIDAAAESTAKKTLGNSDLLNKLRGQMRPQMNEESASTNKDAEISISPLSLFGQPIGQGKKDNAKDSSSAPPQHANAKIVQTATVSSKPSGMTGSMQKSGSGRVITAQSQNGASVSSVQPRDLEAEKAEAERKQKEKERQEEERKQKEEKSARVLDKFKRKASTGEKTKAGAAWLWSKVSSGAVWIWAGIAPCFLWIVTSPKRAWQKWRIFNRSWWSGIGTGVWNTVKKPFVKSPSAETAETNGDSAVPSGSEAAPVSQEPALTTASRKRKSQKKNVDIWDADSAATSSDSAATDAFASKEPDSRRRLYLSLSSIGAAAVVFLFVLPSLLTGSKKSDETAVAVNKQEIVSNEQESANASELVNVTSNETASDGTTPLLNDSASDLGNTTPNMRGSNSDMRGSNSDMQNRGSMNADPRTGYERGSSGGREAARASGRGYASEQADFGAARFHSGTDPVGGQYPMSPSGSGAYRATQGRNDSRAYDRNQPIVPPGYSDNNARSSYGDSEPELSAPDIVSPEVPELDMSVPEAPVPEVTELEAPDVNAALPDADLSVPETPELTAPEETTLETPEYDATLPDADLSAPDTADSELSAPEEVTLDAPETDLAAPDASIDEVPVPDDIEADVSEPDLSDPEVPSADDSVVELSTPLTPEAETKVVAPDPFNVPATDVPEDPTVDLTADLNSPSPAADEPDVTVPQDVTDELPTPDADVPDASLSDLSDSAPVELPVETPEIPAPTVPEPSEPSPIDTGIASQSPESDLPSAPLLNPEDSLPNDSQLASSAPGKTLTSPEPTPVELGAPGPLVSSANTAAASPSTQVQNVARVNSNSYNSSTSTDPGYGINGYNSGYVYNSSGVYTVQPNDSFWTIAKRIYGSGEYARALAQYNSSRVSPQSLSVSVQIMTPPPETLEQQFPELCPIRSSAAYASKTPENSTPAGTRVYIVDQEESVMEIARRELGSILYCSQVYSLNQELLSGNVDRVKPGVRLLLPVKN